MNKKIKILCTLLFLSGCSFEREPEIKIVKFSEAYPQFLKDCPLNNHCTINGGNEKGIFYTLNYEDQVSLKRFDFALEQSSTLYEYEGDGYIINTMIEKDGIYYYTEERLIPMDIENIENIQNPFVVQYSVKALKNDEISILASDYYPNYNASVSLRKLGDAIMMIAPVAEYNEGFTEMITYGYTVYFIHELEIENIFRNQVKWNGFQGNEMMMEPSGTVHSITDQIVLITSNSMQTCFTVFDESGKRTENCRNNDSDGFILQSAGDTVIYEQLLNKHPYQSNYSLYGIDSLEEFKLKEYPKLLYAECLTDDYLYAFGHNDEEKQYYKKVHYLVQIKEGDLFFHKLNIDGETNQFTSIVLAENKAILADNLHGNDVYMIEW